MKQYRCIRRCVFHFFITCLLVSCHLGKHADISVIDPRVNDENNPAGIDTGKPVFSWKLVSEERNRLQSAYQVIVVEEHTADTIWNSGMVFSDQQRFVKYSGRPLNPVNAFRWQVRIWDQDGKISRWSDAGRFTTGLMEESDWKAEWISSPDSVYSPVFTRAFYLDELPVKASAFVNCQGYYELYVNGQKIGNDVLSPAISDFRFENYYLTYDIARYLRKGSNTLGVWTGRGWYSTGLPGVMHGSPVFRLQAHLDYGQDREEVIVSDTTWVTFESNIRQIGRWRWNQMGGELIDGTVSMDNWQEGIAGRKPENAIVISKPPAQTRAQLCRANVITDTLQVQDIKDLGDNIWLVDFGKNFTGWMEMKIRNQSPGDTIDFIYSDFCNKIPERQSKYRWDFGNEYIDQRNGYICAGGLEEIFCPKFNFQAFRYVLLQGLREEPQPEDMKGYMIESDLSPAGTFSSSDEDLDAIYALNRYTFRCLDMGGYYVDCPHRERLGYGDGQVAVETGIFSFELANFYKKWALNWIYGQSADGEFQHTAPSPYPAGGGPGWGGTGVVLPWKIFTYYGDSAFLDFSYPYMVRYLEFLETKSRNGILEHYGDETWGFIGDWVPPGKGMDSDKKVGPAERELFNNCYKIYLYDIVAECAGVLGREDDRHLFVSRSDTLRRKVHSLYFDNEKGTYANGEQSYLAFPLLLDVPPDGQTPHVMNKLEHDIRVTQHGHLNTGMLGTYFMLQYLTEAGRSDLVYLMMKQKTYPGWGYMISQGATTCWEQWNGYWSNIHSCFTSAGGWFFNGIAGIGQKENSVAFKHLVIAPQLTDSIDSQETVFNSPYGKVQVLWSRNNNHQLQLDIEIPVNTRADIRLPVSRETVVTESGRPLSALAEAALSGRKDDHWLITVPSGRYRFEIRTM